MWWAFFGLQVRCLVSWCDYGFFLGPPDFFSFFLFLLEMELSFSSFPTGFCGVGLVFSSLGVHFFFVCGYSLDAGLNSTLGR